MVTLYNTLNQSCVQWLKTCAFVYLHGAWGVSLVQLKLTYLHLSVFLRWRCHGVPVSQHTLPAPSGSLLPEPLNVAPSLSSLPVKETIYG